MGDHKLNRPWLLRSLFLLALVFFLQLAYASLQLSNYSEPSQNTNQLTVAWNPFFDSQYQRIANAEQAVVEARRQLSFMTFSRERSRAAQQVLLALYEKINQQPFYYQHWAELVALQQSAAAPVEDRLWSIKAALDIGGWNQNYRLYVAAQCLEEPAELFEYFPALCRSLLRSLPYQSLSANAKYMGVRPEFLQQRLTELDRVYVFDYQEVE